MVCPELLRIEIVAAGNLAVEGTAQDDECIVRNVWRIVVASHRISDQVVRREHIYRQYSPVEHDRITSYISHVPHVIAASLVNLVAAADSPDNIFKSLAAGGFKDITRIASSNPVVWEHILLANPDNIVNGLQEYVELIDKMIYHIKQRDAAGINAFFASARDYRDSIPNNSSGVIRMHHELFVDIPDEAGAIAKVTALIAEAKISLKNIGVSHNREDEEGVLRLSFYDAESRKNAQDALKAAGYKIYNR